MPPRTLREISAAIKKGDFAPAYYLHGSEEVRKDEAIHFILDRALDPSLRDFNFDQGSAAQLDAEAVEAMCNTMPMMADRRVVLIRDVDQWKRRTKGRSAFLRYLEQPSPSTVVILVQGAAEADPDKELLKATDAIACAPPTPGEASKWLERYAETLGVTLTEGGVRLLLDSVGSDLTALRAELDKLSALPLGDAIGEDEIAQLVGIRRGETALDWRNAVMEGDAGLAARLVPVVLDQRGNSGVRLVAMIGMTLAGLGVTRAAYDAGGRGRALSQAAFAALKSSRPFGLGAWGDEAARWAKWAPDWPLERVEDAARAALDADMSLKNTTLSDEGSTLTDLTFRIASASAGVGR